MNMKAIIVLFISVFLPFGAVNATVVMTGTPAGIIRSTIAPDDEEKLDHFIGMARELEKIERQAAGG